MIRPMLTARPLVYQVKQQAWHLLAPKSSNPLRVGHTTTTNCLQNGAFLHAQSEDHSWSPVAAFPPALYVGPEVRSPGHDAQDRAMHPELCVQRPAGRRDGDCERPTGGRSGR